MTWLVWNLSLSLTWPNIIQHAYYVHYSGKLCSHDHEWKSWVDKACRVSWEKCIVPAFLPPVACGYEWIRPRMGNLSGLSAMNTCSIHPWSCWSTGNQMVVLKQEHWEQTEPQRHSRCFRGSLEGLGWRTCGAKWSWVPVLSTCPSGCLSVPLSDFYRAWHCLVALFYGLCIQCYSFQGFSGWKVDWGVISVEGIAEPVRMKEIKGTDKRKWPKMNPDGAFCGEQEK